MSANRRLEDGLPMLVIAVLIVVSVILVAVLIGLLTGPAHGPRQPPDHDRAAEAAPRSAEEGIADLAAEAHDGTCEGRDIPRT